MLTAYGGARCSRTRLCAPGSIRHLFPMLLALAGLFGAIRDALADPGPSPESCQEMPATSGDWYKWRVTASTYGGHGSVLNPAGYFMYLSGQDACSFAEQYYCASVNDPNRCGPSKRPWFHTGTSSGTCYKADASPPSGGAMGSVAREV